MTARISVAEWKKTLKLSPQKTAKKKIKNWLSTTPGNSLNKSSQNWHGRALEQLTKNPALIKGKKEHYSQVRVFDYIYKNMPDAYKFFFAVPNAGKRGARAAMEAKAEGLRSGVADMILAAPRGPYHYAAIELKTDTGRMTEAQKEWAIATETAGGLAALCRGHENTIQLIEAYWSLGPFDPAASHIEEDLYLSPWR